MAEVDHQLYFLIKQGDEKAFERFFHLYYPRLKAFAFRLIADKDTAEDLVQEVFVSLWENRRQINLDKSLKSWIFLSLRNNSLNFLRRQKTEQKYLDYLSFQNSSQELFLSSFLEDHEIELLKNQAVQQVMEIIEHLPVQCRKVFEMSRFGKIKNQDIASELDISIRTVETHISNAIKSIKKQIKSNPIALTLVIALLFEL